MAWTDDKIETLKRMWEKGSTGTEIGEAVGFSRAAVIGKAHRLGLEARINPVDHDALFERVADLVIESEWPISIERAADQVRISRDLALHMWNERIHAHHGGDPK